MIAAWGFTSTTLMQPFTLGRQAWAWWQGLRSCMCQWPVCAITLYDQMLDLPAVQQLMKQILFGMIRSMRGLLSTAQNNQPACMPSPCTRVAHRRWGYCALECGSLKTEVQCIQPCSPQVVLFRVLAHLACCASGWGLASKFCAPASRHLTIPECRSLIKLAIMSSRLLALMQRCTTRFCSS